jgi:hypothetical protein
LSTPRDWHISAGLLERQRRELTAGGRRRLKSVEKHRAQIVDKSREIWHKMLADLGERGRLLAWHAGERSEKRGCASSTADVGKDDGGRERY